MAASTCFASMSSMANLGGVNPAPLASNQGQGVGVTIRDREPGLLRRIKELEEEVRVLRLDNERQVSHLFRLSLGIETFTYLGDFRRKQVLQNSESGGRSSRSLRSERRQRQMGFYPKVRCKHS